MKSIWTGCALLVLLLTACSSPSPPAPAVPVVPPHKYTLEVVFVGLPEKPLNDKVDPVWLLHHPQAELSVFPIVYAALGETVVTDRTERVPVPESCRVVYDAAKAPQLVYDTQPVPIGQRVELTVLSADSARATCRIQVYEALKKGMRSYEVHPEGSPLDTMTALLPVLRKRSATTTVTLAFGKWQCLDESPVASSSAETNGRFFQLVRIVPPADSAAVNSAGPPR
jgi:hypothetical protein